MFRRLAVAFALALAVPAAGAKLSAASTAGPALNYGISWYPEQRGPETWDADLKLIKAAGFTFVRVGEFAWARMEPREGVYDFVWLDAAIVAARAHGLDIVIGTPTAGPPVWLTQTYPEVLGVDAAGRPQRHGARRHFSVASLLYRDKARGIATKLAERYGRAPRILGFQIDNEYGKETFDPAAVRAWHLWLAAKYKTIDALNKAWFTVAWSQTYSDWAQIPVPDERDNPGLALDWLRFFSDAWRDYQQVQIDAIRLHLAPGRFITHNYTGRWDNFDFGLTAQRLDLVTWDWYFGDPVVDPADAGFLHDMYRGFLDRNVWVMETAAGNTNWAERNFTEPKGELRAKAWQAVGHGADGYAFWVWRPTPNGIEQFHGALTDVGGRPAPVYSEAAQVGRELAAVGDAVRGSVPVVDVALLHDYPSRWALRRLPMTKDYDPLKVFTSWYGALKPAVTGVAVLRGPERLSRYKLVVAPSLHVMTGADAAALTAYVQGGGHLVLGPRSGVKDASGSLWEPGQPGPLAALIGAHVDQANIPPPGPVALDGPAGPSAASTWAERLAIDAPDVEVRLRYVGGDGWLDGLPGVVSRKVGKGRVTYIGALLDTPSLRREIAASASAAHVVPLFPGLPEGVEATTRDGPRGRVHVLVNWGASPATVSLPRSYRDLLAGGSTDRLALPRFGVSVLGER